MNGYALRSGVWGGKASPKNPCSPASRGQLRCPREAGEWKAIFGGPLALQTSPMLEEAALFLSINRDKLYCAYSRITQQCDEILHEGECNPVEERLDANSTANGKPERTVLRK